MILALEGCLVPEQKNKKKTKKKKPNIAWLNWVWGGVLCHIRMALQATTLPSNRRSPRRQTGRELGAGVKLDTIEMGARLGTITGYHGSDVGSSKKRPLW